MKNFLKILIFFIKEKNKTELQRFFQAVDIPFCRSI